MSYSKPDKTTQPANSMTVKEVGRSVPDEAVLQVSAAGLLMPNPTIHLAKEMGELSEKLNSARDENNRLKEKVKTMKKDNKIMSNKIDTLEDQNSHQRRTIQTLESAVEKLQKELENIKKTKDRLRIEIEEKNSTFRKENEILLEKLEALTKDFAAVEKENEELKQRLEDLTNSNNCLQKTVKSIKDENKSLKTEMESLKAEHDKISKKLERKEAKLALGQVAWLLEKEIWQIVLPQENMGTTRILKSMERWLKKNSASEEGTAAEKRWEDLKCKLNWNDEDHRAALKTLKTLRLADAHPKDVDLEEARRQLKEENYVADCDKESCQDIINMIGIARNLKQTKI